MAAAREMLRRASEDGDKPGGEAGIAGEETWSPRENDEIRRTPREETRAYTIR